MIMELFYISMLNTTLIYGEINETYKCLKKMKKLYGNRIREGLSKLAEIHIEALEQKISICEAKEKILELAKEYPESFLLNRENIGDAKKSAYGYIHRLEYAINRYDVKYPYFNMQRCDDL
ncbi:MAG: hypothetical protein QXG55_04585 [Thermoplasmata archaeon]